MLYEPIATEPQLSPNLPILIYHQARKTMAKSHRQWQIFIAIFDKQKSESLLLSMSFCLWIPGLFMPIYVGEDVAMSFAFLFGACNVHGLTPCFMAIEREREQDIDHARRGEERQMSPKMARGPCPRMTERRRKNRPFCRLCPLLHFALSKQCKRHR